MAIKLKVKPEGRDGVWLAEKQDVIDWLKEYPEEQIHNYVNSGPIMAGADWGTEIVITFIENSARIAILTGSAQRGNMRHALSVISDNQLWMFDIGPITEDDLDVVIEPPCLADELATMEREMRGE